MIKNKKVLIIGILLVILFIPSAVGAVELTDIDGHWAEDEIRKLVGMGAITGYPDETYRPEGTITRAEFSSVLRGAMGLAEVPGTTFADTIGHWGEGRIEALVQAGVIDTDLYGQNYLPDDFITREEIAMMTVRMLGELTGATDIPFLDAAQISTGYDAYVAEAYARGIVRGYPDDTFRPLGTATRAEAAVMVIRALGIAGTDEEDEEVEEPEEEVEEPSEAIPTIVSFTTDYDSLIAGTTATLSWEVSDAVTVTLDHDIGEVDPFGSYDISPSETTTYTLTASNSAGSDTAEVTIEVMPFGMHDPLFNGIIIPPPSIVHFSADKSGMTEGISATLSWEVSGIATVTIEPDIGEVDKTGSYVVSPTETTTYTLTAGNVSGSVAETVTIKVRPPLTFQPGPGEGKDVLVTQAGKNTTYSHWYRLRIGRMHGYAWRSLIQFDDINSIHPDTVIVSASLELYQFDTHRPHGQEQDFTTFAHRITTPWDINTATWNNSPQFQIDPPESASTVVAGAVTWLSWDITNLVQDWVSGEHPNYGVLLRKTNENSGSTIMIAWSSRHTDNPGLRPKLVLTYYVP